MASAGTSLHSKVHDWIGKVGFQLNSSSLIKNDGIIVEHYFFETFNFLQHSSKDSPEESKYVCFDMYGEKIKVRSLLDLQSAFYENLSELK